MIKNSITGFVDPKHKYHKLVGIKSDTEFKKKWALQKKLKDCLEIFYEVKFEEELTVYNINHGEKNGSFRCDNYALINNYHVDFEYNGPDHYNSTFKIHTDKRKAETLQDAEKNTDKDNGPGRKFEICKVPYYMQLTRDYAKYLFQDWSKEKLGKSYYTDEKFTRAIKTIYNTDDENKVYAPGLHSSKATFANFNEPGMHRFLKEMKEMSLNYPSIKHQIIHSLKLYINDVGEENKHLIIPENNKDFDKWFDLDPEEKYLNCIFPRSKKDYNI